MQKVERYYIVVNGSYITDPGSWPFAAIYLIFWSMAFGVGLLICIVFAGHDTCFTIPTAGMLNSFMETVVTVPIQIEIKNELNEFIHVLQPLLRCTP